VNDQATLAAGGLVPAGSKLGKDDAVDTVIARAYAHPVLPGRSVIRLCAEGVAAGDDLEMSTLGFAAGEDRGAVGKERKRPLGFPGWALVNDPGNARFALDVVKELKKHARKAKSKPGHAKEAFDAIAAKLAKTVPHFLPSFYEEVGRVFIEHGATSYAAAMFGKARQVEAVHALEVDEQHRIDGFLEFALAGALTTKALSEYGKSLSEHHEPAVAYAHFRQLCVQRTLGGMPPWSGMAKDLGRLAKAAKLDAAKEDAALIAEIIESHALAKAAGEFWRAYAEPITALGKANATVRGLLLNLFPTGATYSAELDETWLDLLEATGAIDALLGDDVPPEARPTNGRAAWFDKLCGHLARSWRSSVIPPRAYQLLRRMAPAALIADGKPIKGAGRYRVDLDIAELALELGVLVDPPDQWHADASQWVQCKAIPEHGRDPVRCAAHPKLAGVLRMAVVSSIGNEGFDNATRGMQGFVDAKRQWLEEAIASAETAALPALDVTLGILEQKASAATFAELPDLHARLAAIDIAPALARTLRVGIIDEFGWPALEALLQEIDPDGKTAVTMHGAPAALVVATATRATALVGNERKASHDFVIPPKHELLTVRYISDQFLVVLKEGYKVKAYWSNAPRDLWEAESLTSWSIPTSVAYATVLADGAWLEGTKPIRPGDRVLPFSNRIAATDGTTSWVQEWSNGEYRFRELTPTGELGRHTWPAWIEAYAADDWKLDVSSHYLPAPVGITDSPLGVSDGFVGTRIRYRGASYHQPAQRELETIDGHQLACAGTIRAHALLAFPDGGARRPLEHEQVSNKGLALLIHEPACAYVGSKLWGGDLRYGRGQAMPMSSAFLHLYAGRDAAGSRRIHAATDDDARALIAAAPSVAADQPPPVDLPGVLPEVTHPLLRRGLAGLASMAAQQKARRDQLVTQRAPGNAATVTSVGPDDKTMLDMLSGWAHRQYARDGSAWAQIERVGAAFASEDRSDRTIKGLGSSVFDWLQIAVVPSSLVFVGLAIGTPADKRLIAVALFEHLTGKLPPTGQLRVLHVHGLLAGEDHNATEFQVRWNNGNAYAIRQWGYSGNDYHVLEYAPSGTFALLPGLLGDSELRGQASTVAAGELRDAVTAGKTSWSAAAAERLAAATGMTPSEAVLVWAGCPNANNRNANFLDKDLRETLGLKATQAALARDALAVAKYNLKIAAIDEAGRAGVAALLDGTAVDVLAAAWKRMYGERVAIPETLVAEADAMSLSSNVAAMLALVLGGKDSPQLAVDGYYAFDIHGTLIRAGKVEPLVGQTKIEQPDPAFDSATLSMLAAYLPFLYAALPVGDPLRARAVTAYELGLARLASPHLWLTTAAAWLDPDKVEAIDRLLTSLGGELVPGLEEGRTMRRLPGGAVIRVHTNIVLAIRPCELDAKTKSTIDPLAAEISSSMAARREVELLRSADLRAMMARIAETPVPAGGWEQNPLASTPKLVDKVAKQLKLSREAAALYLQYLVLLWPTPKDLVLYNDWKPKQLAAAQSELVDKELVLEAKRERAQRGHFLPGGWEALKSPHPPLETWKLPFYGDRNAAGAVTARLHRFQAHAPFHLLFERAWARIEDGDKPRYEEVKR
jgi:hypothetical protein